MTVRGVQQPLANPLLGTVGRPLAQPGDGAAARPQPAGRPAAPPAALRAQAPLSGAAATLPAEAPPGTDPELWSVLTGEERAFFAKAAATGPAHLQPHLRRRARPAGAAGAGAPLGRRAARRPARRARLRRDPMPDPISAVGARTMLDRLQQLRDAAGGVQVPVLRPGGAEASGGPSFGDTLKGFVNDVSAQQDAAGELRDRFLRGEQVELHQVMAAARRPGCRSS
jgi:flagellar hook-basal body complex protein FliE